MNAQIDARKADQEGRRDSQSPVETPPRNRERKRVGRYFARGQRPLADARGSVRAQRGRSSWAAACEYRRQCAVETRRYHGVAAGETVMFGLRKSEKGFGPGDAT